MGITKREIASELGVSKRTIANYIGKLGLGNHVSRNGNTDFLDDFAAAAIADALKNPEKPSRQPAAAPAAPAPDSLADSLAAQLEIERSRNAELMDALAAERDRAARAEAEAKAQLSEANARVAELAGKLASLAERQQAIAATPWWRRGRMAMKLLGPGGNSEEPRDALKGLRGSSAFIAAAGSERVHELAVDLDLGHAAVLVGVIPELI